MSRRSPDPTKKPQREKRRIRSALGRRLLAVGVLRRWYVRRILKFIDKSKAKGRRMPEGMADTARYLSRVPKHKRADALEEAIRANQEVPAMGREYRRAATRQRRSGQSDARLRPGLPPGARRQGPRRPA